MRATRSGDRQKNALFLVICSACAASCTARGFSCAGLDLRYGYTVIWNHHMQYWTTYAGLASDTDWHHILRYWKNLLTRVRVFELSQTWRKLEITPGKNYRDRGFIFAEKGPKLRSYLIHELSLEDGMIVRRHDVVDLERCKCVQKQLRACCRCTMYQFERQVETGYWGCAAWSTYSSKSN